MTCTHENQRPGAYFCDQCGAELEPELKPLTDEQLRYAYVYASEHGHAAALRAVVNAHDKRMREIVAKREVLDDADLLQEISTRLCGAEVRAEDIEEMARDIIDTVRKSSPILTPDGGKT